MISVCINTRNRPEKLMRCVKSILNNSFKSYEIIIIDQSTKGSNTFFLKNIKVKYFISPQKGVGFAKNFALKKAKGEIVAFTDDDCIVNTNWLQNISQSLKENKNIAGVFGKVLPYKQKSHKNMICLCTFLKKKNEIITKPCIHYKKIGFGNNMAFRKNALIKIGGFKNWLGPGSIGNNAEDAEISYRMLLNDFKILYNSKIIVWHDRWFKKDSSELKRQMRSYACGELAAYGFYALKGEKIAKKVVKNHLICSFLNSIMHFKKALKKLSLKLIFDIFLDIFYDVRGILIALWYSKFSQESRFS